MVGADHEVPLKTTACPSKSDATQKDELTQEMLEMPYWVPTDTGEDHVVPLNVVTLPFESAAMQKLALGQLIALKEICPELSMWVGVFHPVAAATGRIPVASPSIMTMQNSTARRGVWVNCFIAQPVYGTASPLAQDVSHSSQQHASAAADMFRKPTFRVKASICVMPMSCASSILPVAGGM